MKLLNQDFRKVVILAEKTNPRRLWYGYKATLTEKPSPCVLQQQPDQISCKSFVPLYIKP